MATRVTLFQVNVCPTAPDADQETIERNSVAIPHIPAGWCQVVSSQFIGGGGDRRFLLDIAVFEPFDEQDEPAKAHRSQKADRPDGDS